MLFGIGENEMVKAIGMVGAPIDKNDSTKKLRDYVSKNRPPYELNEPWNVAQRDTFSQIVQSKLVADVLPATVIVNDQGQVIAVLAGAPTVSDVVCLLKQ